MCESFYGKSVGFSSQIDRSNSLLWNVEVCRPMWLLTIKRWHESIYSQVKAHWEILRYTNWFLGCLFSVNWAPVIFSLSFLNIASTSIRWGSATRSIQTRNESVGSTLICCWCKIVITLSFFAKWLWYGTVVKFRFSH